MNTAILHPIGYRVPVGRHWFVQAQRNGGSENQSRRSKLSGFSFAVMRQIINSFYFELLLCYLMSAIGMNRQECKHK